MNPSFSCTPVSATTHLASKLLDFKIHVTGSCFDHDSFITAAPPITLQSHQRIGDQDLLANYAIEIPSNVRWDMVEAKAHRLLGSDDFSVDVEKKIALYDACHAFATKIVTSQSARTSPAQGVEDAWVAYKAKNTDSPLPDHILCTFTSTRPEGADGEEKTEETERVLCDYVTAQAIPSIGCRAELTASLCNTAGKSRITRTAWKIGEAGQTEVSAGGVLLAVGHKPFEFFSPGGVKKAVDALRSTEFDVFQGESEADSCATHLRDDFLAASLEGSAFYGVPIIIRMAPTQQ
ncbi:uncharacterized protein MKK02DRAFT_43256 [Dioszegia hungarica]|uniref:Uncharacterized protein n=1 Tax=Dioszegia hungarica TaxID=4972 RepID=A0AA38LW74_9TREE|nr:uncharacterized protein MKK02DRAFT_43256 [Dioszegia hungarica]KAI9637333.1 hypothetical protein MKK02DRAFT_43256 [Dioszegia hungarica]